MCETKRKKANRFSFLVVLLFPCSHRFDLCTLLLLASIILTLFQRQQSWLYQYRCFILIHGKPNARSSIRTPMPVLHVVDALLTMETASTNDEHTPFTSKEVVPTKLRSNKDRHRSQAPVSPASTDINDPENLDYEDEDAKVDDEHSLKQRNDSISNLDENTKSSMNIQVSSRRELSSFRM